MNIDQLDPTQREAYDRCCGVVDGTSTKRIAAVTGPAGSGKTTLIRLVHEHAREHGIETVLCAPTGKAARRIREATGIPAMTIHMLLEYGKPGDRDPRTGKARYESFPKRSREYPLSQQLVIADEYAMVNQELHDNLLAALPPGGRIIVFGDNSQLPPVEKVAAIAKQPSAFSVLLDKFDGVRLTTVHRQAGDSGVLENAQRILAGRAPRQHRDFDMVQTNTPVDVLRPMLRQYDFGGLVNQIITPANVSWVGTHKMNNVLQPLIHPRSREMFKLDRHPWSKQEVHVGVGDKVIIKANWYAIECSNGETGVFNGETGIVTEIDHEIGVITVDLGDRIAEIPPAIQVEINGRIIVGFPHRDLFLAYAITTHGAQGSEYDRVVYLLNRSILNQCNRRNIYTAVTRAKQHVTLMYDSASLSMSITQKEPRVWEN